MLTNALILAATLLAAPAFAEDQADLDSTVKSIITEEYPDISFKSEEFKYLYRIIAPQVSAIFNNHIKVEMQPEMYQTMDIAESRLIIKVEDEVELGPEITVDGQLSTAISEINALIATYEIVKIESMNFGNMYLISFKADENPRFIAGAFRDVEQIDFAEADISVGEKKHVIKRLSDVLYVVKLSWGDCPAGCILSNRTYIEAYRDGTTYFVGRAGDAIDQDLLDQIFISP